MVDEVLLPLVVARPDRETVRKWHHDRQQRFDVVVVGGGSAGAVLAARLSEDLSRTVLLLEAGPAYGLASTQMSCSTRNGSVVTRSMTGFVAHLGRQGGSIARFPRPGPRSWRQRRNQHGGALRRAPTTSPPGPHARVGLVVGRRAGDVPGLENTDGGERPVPWPIRPFPIHQRTYEELTPSSERSSTRRTAGLPSLRRPERGPADGVAPVRLNVASGVRQHTGLAYLTEEVRARQSDRPRSDRGRPGPVQWTDRDRRPDRRGTGYEAARSSCRRVPTAARPSCFDPGSAPRTTWSTWESRSWRTSGRETPPGPAHLHQHLPPQA